MLISTAPKGHARICLFHAESARPWSFAGSGVLEPLKFRRAKSLVDGLPRDGKRLHAATPRAPTRVRRDRARKEDDCRGMRHAAARSMLKPSRRSRPRNVTSEPELSRTRTRERDRARHRSSHRCRPALSLGTARCPCSGGFCRTCRTALGVRAWAKRELARSHYAFLHLAAAAMDACWATNSLCKHPQLRVFPNRRGLPGTTFTRPQSQRQSQAGLL
jgi:hypothetical protein